jgi:hypothetical protein
MTDISQSSTRNIARAAALAAASVSIAILPGCAKEPPNAPGPQTLHGQVALVSPANGGRFKQNDASLGCSEHAARGYGFRVAFDWQAVDGAAEYQIEFWHKGSQFPAVQRAVSTTEYEETRCNSFVIDSNLDHWAWRVAAIGPARDGAPPEQLWSEEREYGFEPCRLSNGQPCFAPPP